MVLTLRGVNVVDIHAGKVRPHVNVSIEGTQLLSVSPADTPPEEGEVLDLPGRYVMPGLINAHVHLVWDGSPDPRSLIAGEPDSLVAIRAHGNALEHLRCGVTTVRDCGGPAEPVLAVAAASRMSLMPGPRVLSAGSAICMTGGHGHYMAMEADGVEGCRRAARLMLKRGADFLKVMATGGVYTPGQEAGAVQFDVEEMRAVVNEAHKAGKRVAAHAEGAQGVKNSLLAGVDTIEHGVGLDQECLDLMLEKGAWLVPTLVALSRLAGAGPESGVPDFAVKKAKRLAEAHLESFSRAIRSGVRIAAGTDAGSPYNPPEDIVTELELMVQAGASPAAALRSATWHAAEALGLSGLGLVEPGWEADLIVLEDDPLRHLGTLRRPLMVIKGGSRVWPAAGGDR